MRTGGVVGNLVDVQIEHFLIEVSIDNKDVLRGSLNKGTQVAIKFILFAGFVDGLDFSRLGPRAAEQHQDHQKNDAPGPPGDRRTGNYWIA